MTLGRALSALKEAFVPTAPTHEDLIERIHAFRQKQDANKKRAHDHLYVTDFAYKPCMRRLAFTLLRPDIKDKARDAKILFKMDAGTAIHAWFQEEVLGPMGILSGKWECNRCGHVEVGTMPTSPCMGTVNVLDALSDEWVETPCKDVGLSHVENEEKKKNYVGMKWLFKEQRVVLNYHGIEVTGRLDGVIVVMGDRLLEIKTTDSERFAQITGPKDYHVFQASVYAAQQGFKEIEILYVDQGDWSNIKAYPVMADPEALTFIENCCEIIRLLLDTKDPMRASAACKNRSAYKARECGCKNICFPLKRKAAKKTAKRKSGKKKER